MGEAVVWEQAVVGEGRARTGSGAVVRMGIRDIPTRIPQNDECVCRTDRGGAKPAPKRTSPCGVFGHGAAHNIP